MFNSTLGFSSSLDIFRNEFSRLDSIEPNSSLVLISDSSSMVFLHLVKSIFPKDFSFRVNKFRSIEMNEVEFSSCKSFLRAHQDRLEFVFDSIATSLNVAKQYKRFPVHSFQISAIHFLDKNAGKEAFDFDAICNYYITHIRKNKQSLIGYYDLDSDDYLFLTTIYPMLKEPFGWDINKWYIHQKVLKDIEAWCMSSSILEDIQLRLFDTFCQRELNEYFSLESILF